jgi:hypothetical protein
LTLQFKNYWDWEDWLNPKHFADNDMTAWSSVDTIRELDKSELTDILAYGDGKDKPDTPSEDSSSDSTPTPTLGSSSFIHPLIDLALQPCYANS